MQRMWANLARNLHLRGIRRHAYAQSRRLITGGRRFKSCPRYGPISDQVLKVAGFCEGARDERLHAYLAGVAVECDREAECVEHATAKLGIGGGERFSEVGERVEDLAGVVEVDRGVCAASVVKLG
jgi:hypothetical protein